MAKRIIERLIDDIDGGEAAETVAFSFGGTNYTIDLSKENAEKLRDELARFVGVATRTGRSTSGTWRPGLAPGPRRDNGVDNKAVRAWAADNGFELSDRGRIPLGVVNAYTEAQNSPAEPAEPAEPAKPAKKAPRKKVPAANFQTA